MRERGLIKSYVRRYILFGGTFVFVTFACLLCYNLGMAESQRGGELDIYIESRGELNAVADNSAVSERIVALKKSKAGHLGD